MAEEEPPNMACDICKYQEDVRSVTRQQNRALRIVNRNLRRREEAIIAQRDASVEALLESPSEAEEAFGELWGSALFDCGPQDYDYMVAEIRKAFAFVEAHKSE
jgi:hypothetical protein